MSNKSVSYKGVAYFDGIGGVVFISGESALKQELKDVDYALNYYVSVGKNAKKGFYSFVAKGEIDADCKSGIFINKFTRFKLLQDDEKQKAIEVMLNGN